MGIGIKSMGVGMGSQGAGFLSTTVPIPTPVLEYLPENFTSSGGDYSADHITNSGLGDATTNPYNLGMPDNNLEQISDSLTGFDLVQGTTAGQDPRMRVGYGYTPADGVEYDLLADGDNNSTFTFSAFVTFPNVPPTGVKSTLFGGSEYFRWQLAYDESNKRFENFFRRDPPPAGNELQDSISGNGIEAGDRVAVVARVSGDDGPGPGTSVRLYISGYDEYTADWSSNPWTPGVGWTSKMFWVAENSVGPIFSNWNEKVGFGEIRFWDYALTDAEFEAERDRLEAKWKV